MNKMKDYDMSSADVCCSSAAYSRMEIFSQVSSPNLHRQDQLNTNKKKHKIQISRIDTQLVILIHMNRTEKCVSCNTNFF